jgi:O-acetyl-ADP-ribose deacetylase (regulator of RNase III)
MTQILIEQGDLTTYNVDAIVNPANNDLILGGGLAGAIARRGGPAIQEECNRLGPIEIGQAAITTAGRLPAKYVIHAASMRLGAVTSAQSLADSVRASLKIANDYQLATVAFPAIGTGIARFPIDRCAEIMLTCFLNISKENSPFQKIYVVLFDSEAYNVFCRIHEKLTR